MSFGFSALRDGQAGPNWRMRARRPTRFQVAGLLGVGTLAGLIAYFGVGSFTTAFAAIGWGIAAVVLVRLGQVLAAGVAWRLVLPADVPWWACPLLRVVREAINGLFPVAQVGGEVVGARLLTRFGVRGGVAAASVLADVLVQAGTQLLFALLGVSILLAAGDRTLALWMSAGLAVLALALAAFWAVQRWGGLAWLEVRLARIAGGAGWTLPGGIAGLSESLAAIHSQRTRLAGAAAIHMAIWLFGALEVWIVLHILGAEPTIREAIAIESLSHAARAAFFIVPGGLGVQDGAILALGSLYGLSPQFALAVALAKRVADILLGLPGLAIWQAIELRRLAPTKQANV
jgi:putative membrane protein